MDDPREYLTAAQQRAEQATEGPWMLRPSSSLRGAHQILGVAPVLRAARADAEFIAAARTDVERLATFALAVLDLHTEEVCCTDPECFSVCAGCDEEWPCPTVRIADWHLTDTKEETDG